MRKIFMASLALTALAVGITLFQMASCKKSNAQNCPPAVYPVAGLWEGTYQTDQVSHVPTYISFSVYPDGSFGRKAKVVGSTEVAYYKGRWQMSGNTFTWRDTVIAYSGGNVISGGTLTFSNNGTMSAGTWHDFSAPSYTGTHQNFKRVN